MWLQSCKIVYLGSSVFSDTQYKGDLRRLYLQNSSKDQSQKLSNEQPCCIVNRCRKGVEVADECGAVWLPVRGGEGGRRTGEYCQCQSSIMSI